MATEKAKESREIAARKPISGLTQMEQEMERWFDDVMGRPWRRLGLPDWWRRRELIPRQPAVELSEDDFEGIGIEQGEVRYGARDIRRS